jgi:hypothetical protein
MRETAKQFTDANTYESIIASPELVNQFLDLCYEVFGEVPECGTCGNAFTYYKNLVSYGNNLPTAKMNNKGLFRLKNIQFYSRGLRRVIAPEGMTDELAIKLLQSSRNNHTYFETLPEDWENIVFGKVEDPKIAEAKEVVIVNQPQQQNKLNSKKKRR